MERRCFALQHDVNGLDVLVVGQSLATKFAPNTTLLEATEGNGVVKPIQVVKDELSAPVVIAGR